MLKVGIIGCGDVAFRSYVPALQAEAARAVVTACCDPAPERAARAAALFPGATAFINLADVLAAGDLDAIFNLTPAPLHHQTTLAALDAGLHVYSEKPLAGTLAEGRDLIARADAAGKMLLCAPAVAVTRRFVWLKEVIATGRLGELVLATGQMASLGPAAWRDYTGEPAVFYGPAVGPLVDTGVYLLHGVTALFGPAKRVQAFGGIAMPTRTVQIPRLAGQTVEVATNDVMLLHLDFGGNRFAQILSSYAVAASAAPAMEIHATGGSISISLGQWYDGNGTVDLFSRDESALGVEGWLRGISAPRNPGREGIVEAGPRHVIDCLTGSARPVLTAAHALHVLDIILKAQQSAREGRALETETEYGDVRGEN